MYCKCKMVCNLQLFSRSVSTPLCLLDCSNVWLKASSYAALHRGRPPERPLNAKKPPHLGMACLPSVFVGGICHMTAACHSVTTPLSMRQSQDHSVAATNRRDDASASSDYFYHFKRQLVIKGATLNQCFFCRYTFLVGLV